MNRESFPLSLSAANQNEAPNGEPPAEAAPAAAPAAPAPKEAPRAPPVRWWKNKEKVEYAARLAGLLAVLVGIPGVMLDLPGKWKNFHAGGSPIVHPAAPAATSPGEAASRLRGRFTDHESGDPLAGIRLFFPEQNRETSTNADGLFELELPVAEETRVKLLATLDGYQPVDDDPPAGTFLHQLTMRRVP
jgi:hypothetical protein